MVIVWILGYMHIMFVVYNLCIRQESADLYVDVSIEFSGKSSKRVSFCHMFGLHM